MPTRGVPTVCARTSGEPSKQAQITGALNLTIDFICRTDLVLPQKLALIGPLSIGSIEGIG